MGHPICLGWDRSAFVRGIGGLHSHPCRDETPAWMGHPICLGWDRGADLRGLAVYIPTHAGMRLRDGWGTRSVWVGIGVRSCGGLAVYIPTHAGMRLRHGWGTRSVWV